MALSIFNIVIGTLTSTRFFYTWPTTAAITADQEVLATAFFDDTGAAATAFPALTNGYFNLYINGVAQEADNYTISTTSLTLNTASTDPIIAGTPFIIEAVQI